MYLQTFIARRHLRAKKRTGFISYTSYISIAGIALGVAALLIVLTVHNGFWDLIQTRFLDFDSHLRVVDTGELGLADYDRLLREIRAIPGVVGASPFVQGKGFVHSNVGQSRIMIKGVDPASMGDVNRLREHLVYGDWEFLTEARSGLPGMALGRVLADRLAAVPEDTVTIIGSRAVGSIRALPAVHQFQVEGYFSLELTEYDMLFGITTIPVASALLKLDGRVSGIEVRTVGLEAIDIVATRIRSQLPAGLEVRTWYDLHRNLFASMQVERWAVLIVLSLIIVVAAFNITSSLIMLVLEKRRDIGILQSMGAGSRMILQIFILEGAFIGVLGTLVGLLIGFGACWTQIEYGYLTLPGDVYIVRELPMAMRLWDFVAVPVIALALVFGAALYPARKAANLTPVEAIRYS